MSRATRWLTLRGRQREYALSIALGCSTAVLYRYHAHGGFPHLLADSSQNTEVWRATPSVVPHNRPQSERSDLEIPTKTAVDHPRTTAKPAGPRVPPSDPPADPIPHAEGGLLEDPLQAWEHATDRVAAVCGTFTGVDLTSIREKITGLLVPSWVRSLPGWLDKLRNELSMAPWSLSWEIWEEAHDPEINPEIIWDAKVRLSTDLCREEQTFLQLRRRHTAKALARYLGVPESEVHQDDVPTIAMCGSGGGLRALVAGTSSYLSAAEDGLFDCVTYSAGVSHARVLDHLKSRLNVHIAYPPALLGQLSQAPTNKYLLSGFVEKLRGVPDADFGLVDVYGLALAARLMVPKDDLRVSNYDLKISNQRHYTDEGKQPLPIYTAVRHEIPDVAGDAQDMPKEARFSAKHYDWFQWFEWTPYEFFCEEIGAGIPTWALGRQWDCGRGVWRENGLALPELRVPLFLGVWGSAFCATLSHYYKETRPILIASGLSGLDTMLSGKDDELVKVHPIDPAVIPNFALGLRGKLPQSCPESIYESSHLELMDAGMANNLPIYPLLRPGRNVDVIIAFDASADVKGDNWIKVVDGYARQRNIKGWPMGAGWPPHTNSDEATARQLNAAEDAAQSGMEAAAPNTRHLKPFQADLGYCTVWAGTTEERSEYMDDAEHRRISLEADEAHLKSPTAGIAVIYFPFLANKKVPGVDPMKSEFMSTWNFIYTAEQIDKVVSLAKANYEEGKEQTKRTIRAVWERKRNQRLDEENVRRDFLHGRRVQRGGAAAWRNGDVGHGDQFGGI